MDLRLISIKNCQRLLFQLYYLIEYILSILRVYQMSVALRGDLQLVTLELNTKCFWKRRFCKISAQNIRTIVDPHVKVKLNCKGSAPRKAII